MTSVSIEQPISSRLAGQHSAWQSIILHIAPGLLTGVLFFLFAGLAARMNLPSIAAQMAADVLVIIPLELGLIFIAARKSPTGPKQFMEMIPYREPLPFWKYAALTLAILLSTAFIFAVMSPVTRYLQSLFGWLPDAMVLNIGLEGSYPRSTLIWVTVFNALLIGIILPIIEEFYFRGFLLPRMPEGLKGWTPLAHSFLFALYHFWSPWLIIARTIGLLPLVYGVQRSRNLYVGIIVHCIVNFIDVIAVIAFISALK